jgi:hypothetical protein
MLKILFFSLIFFWSQAQEINLVQNKKIARTQDDTIYIEKKVLIPLFKLLDANGKK